MKLKTLVAPALLLTVAFVAGPGFAQSITDQQMASLKVGTTTYTDVVAQFGRPMTVETSSDGSKVATYSTTKTHTKAASWIPIVGLFAGGAQSDTVSDELTFDSKGVLTKSTVSETHLNCTAVGGCKNN